MPTASFVKSNQFAADLNSGVHNFATGTSHVYKVMLTNSAPSASWAVKADVTEISAGNGYTAGGATVGTITGSQTSGTFKAVAGTDPVFTASGGSIGPFRTAVLYNDTPSSPLKPVVGSWDYGSSNSIATGDNLTVDLDQTGGLFTYA